MLALFSRNAAFLMLGVLSVDVCLYEASLRGYGSYYLWPGAIEWSLRSTVVLGTLSLVLFGAFVMAVANQEKIQLPLRRLFLASIAFEAGLTLTALAGFVDMARSISTFSTPLYTFCVLIIGVALIRSNTPAGKSMMLVALFGLVNAILRAFERLDLLPDYVYAAASGSLGTNPVLALTGFLLNLTALTAWIAFVGKQRNDALRDLAELREKENQRLTEEVARQTHALNQALKYADEKNRQKTQILGYIGHDLRAPLATIVGYARLLDRVVPAADAASIRAIERSATYQMTLIDELLGYAKSELKPLELSPAETSTSDLLEDIVQHAAALSEQQGNRFLCDVSEVLPKTIFLDGRRLQQALLNLLSNAAKFTRAGTIRLSVDAKREGEAWRLAFAVIDSGIGIDGHKQPMIFDAFHQLEPGGDGIGLGLFIAQTIIRRMGSDLKLESRAGQGSRFSFEVSVNCTDRQTFHWAPAGAGDIQLGKERGGVRLDTRQSMEERPLPAGNPLVSSLPAATREPALAPPGYARMELALLARDGHLSDIEHWLQTTAAHYPDCGVFFREIRDALGILDFDAIERLALARPASA